MISLISKAVSFYFSPVNDQEGPLGLYSDVMGLIYSHLLQGDLCRLRRVSKRFRASVSKDDETTILIEAIVSGARNNPEYGHPWETRRFNLAPRTTQNGQIVYDEIPGDGDLIAITIGGVFNWIKCRHFYHPETCLIEKRVGNLDRQNAFRVEAEVILKEIYDLPTQIKTVKFGPSFFQQKMRNLQKLKILELKINQRLNESRIVIPKT